MVPNHLEYFWHISSIKPTYLQGLPQILPQFAKFLLRACSWRSHNIPSLGCNWFPCILLAMDQKPVAPCMTQYFLSGMVRRISLLLIHEPSRRWQQSMLLLLTWKLLTQKALKQLFLIINHLSQNVKKVQKGLSVMIWKKISYGDWYMV